MGYLLWRQGQPCDTKQYATVIFLGFVHCAHNLTSSVLQLEGEKRNFKKNYNTYHMITFDSAAQVQNGVM